MKALVIKGVRAAIKQATTIKETVSSTALKPVFFRLFFIFLFIFRHFFYFTVDSLFD